MRMTEAFSRYGVELTNPQFSSSALSENPREVVLSLWAHNFSSDMARYTSGTAQWKGAGKHIFRRVVLGELVKGAWRVLEAHERDALAPTTASSSAWATWPTTTAWR